VIRTRTGGGEFSGASCFRPNPPQAMGRASAISVLGLLGAVVALLPSSATGQGGPRSNWGDRRSLPARSGAGAASIVRRRSQAPGGLTVMSPEDPAYEATFGPRPAQKVVEGKCVPSDYEQWVVVDVKHAFAMCNVPNHADYPLWVMYFRFLNGAKDWSDTRMTSSGARSGLVYATSKSSSVKEALRGADGHVQRFVVTRNPLTRFFLSFTSKIRRASDKKWRQKFNVDKKVSVEDFIDSLSSMSYEDVGAEFQPQWYICGACEGDITYDRTFQYESVSSAWRWFQAHLGHLEPDEMPTPKIPDDISPATNAERAAKLWAQKNR